MALTKLTADLNIIQALDDEPNDVGGLTSAQLKAKFDEAGNDIKTFINNLIDELAAKTAGASLGAENPDGGASTVQAELDSLNGAVMGAGNVPAGGGTGTLLVKSSAASYDTAWKTLYSILNSLAAVTPASTDKIPLVDVSGGVAGYVTVAALLGGISVPGIAFGSYAGTGVTPTEAAPLSLTFSFAPKLLWIYATYSSELESPIYRDTSSTSRLTCVVAPHIVGSAWCNGGFSHTGSNISRNKTSADKKTFYWYSPDAGESYNSSGYSYYYIAIG